ncbi:MULTISPECIES: ubiquinol-cytochrome c reductase iron-sulfur subunit [Bacillaceae]|uniref:Menaquinol:cytochrome c reductase iron-sulfur subunit n=1 Tax=Mesobacillus selenatarsenatis (strain DSM 18680 / JCM 14380 / FERM P-15431 / SF-1) TaxID=1321606 RepID=A0A0A8X477_MESS1|nr:ubiquinol-cytochrome c reductase iron-sulfur subunit [Mesobacillus selenatarsenatis]MBT2682020.1 ubiquinol-cytochrome c reductase iron-sulfur subunit [Bacillus sp. ISL-37]GAM13832.1 Menaquinone-cytochrome C reductase iron-sulfur subunit [Mesobacillus selenatarsenatis SF-1]
MSKHRVSRRQFLNYTLTGVGGFMAAGMLMPMVRFAVDPVLKGEDAGDFIATPLKIADITNEPQKVNFSFTQKDAWYESEETGTAWVFKNEGGEIVALSPVCKHLGCVVDWNTDKKNPNMFFCPCHYGLYEKDGMNVKGTPPLAPLDVYPTKEKDGFLYVGKAEPRKGA